MTVTGSAFFVSAESHFVIDAPMAKGCTGATITGRGTAHAVAKDANTDLTPLRLDAKPTVPLTPAVFRTTPLQLGEAVSVLGFPTVGVLDIQGIPSPARAGEGGTTQL